MPDAVTIDIDKPDTRSIAKAFDDVGKSVMRKVVAPAVRRAAKSIASTIKQAVPNRTGTMRQAVGAGTLKFYKDGSIAWQAAGVRRGFGRMIAVQQTQGGEGYKLKRLSKAKSKKTANRGFVFENPAKIAHIIKGGRGESRSKGKKALLNPLTGKMFKRSAAAPGKDFIEQAQTSTAAIDQLTQDLNQIPQLLNQSLGGP